MRVVLRSREGRHEIAPLPGENLLYAGLRAGLPLAYECATGTCGTCKARVKRGATEDLWPQAPGRVGLSPDLGDILLCQSAAAGESEILLPGKVVAKPQHRVVPSHGEGRIENVRLQAPEVATFELALDRPLRFLSGQFMALSVPGVRGYRAYSMTGFEPLAERLSFAIKRVAGGAVSRQVFEGDPEGAQVRYFGPLGGAVFLPEEECDILCIAGGSGIAGMMSVLSQAVHEGYLERHLASLFFGVRTMDDLFFAEEIEALCEAAPALEAVVALSEEPPPRARTGGLRVEGGDVHEVAARHMRGRYAGRIAYVAGPPPMVDRSLRVLLGPGGLGADRIRFDKFA